MARIAVVGGVLAAQVLAAMTLGGCGGMKVRGTVLPGPVGRAMVVDARDERLAEPGLAGVTVKALRPGAQTGTGTPLATAVTDEAGRFEMKVEQQRVKGSLTITAEGEAVFRTATTVYPPREGQELLVQVRERRAAAAAGGG